MTCDGTNWVNFFRIVCMHRKGYAFNLDYSRVVEMDECALARSLSMCQPPETLPPRGKAHVEIGLSIEAIEWSQEAA